VGNVIHADRSVPEKFAGYKSKLKFEDASKETLDWMLSKEGAGQ